jgi:glycosyltransferase involved in cell wall biosynthesis
MGAVRTAMARNPDTQFVVYATLFNSDFFGAVPDNVRVDVLPPHDYWQEIGRRTTADAIDVLFRGYPGPTIDAFDIARQIVLVPDIQHEHFPEFFARADLYVRRRLFRSALRGVGAIATISEFARSTIEKSLEAKDVDVFLMSPASQFSSPGGDDDVSRPFTKRVDELDEFFFFPANLWKHKNHERLLEAFRRYRVRTARTTSLALCGHPDGWAALAQRYADVPVHHFGFVSRGELRYLYSRALALTFFSLYEGFGIPLLEAFECGCPVVCSNTTSLPEIAGDAALTCDPTDADAMADALGRIAADSELRQRLAARGKLRSHLYTWGAAADAFVAACRRVALPAARPQPRRFLPLVSIVTPSFNQGAYLRRTIESVLAQTYPNIEYVVMDGGSTDDSVKILQSYGARFRWVSEKDGGQTDAINKGFADSRGEIRGYLNSDDTLLPDAVERVVAFFRDHPDVDMVYGDANYIDQDDRVTGRYNTADYSFDRILADCCVCQPAAFWRTAIARQVGEFDPSLHLAMDYDYWLRIDRGGGNIRHLPSVLANSRLYPETKTRSRRGEIYREIFAICRRHAGRVHPNYYLGYWNHRIHENPGPLALLRHLPVAERWIARAHHVWDARHEAAAEWIASDALRPARRLYRRLSALASVRTKATTASRVRGFFADGWLAPDVSIDTSAIVAHKELYLTGRPAQACRVDVIVGDRSVHSQELPPDRISRVAVVLASPGPIRLRFSSHSVDTVNRRLAFLLRGTNLFSESDVMA